MPGQVSLGILRINDDGDGDGDNHGDGGFDDGDDNGVVFLMM